MVPRTVLMAQEVAAQLTAAQVENYGNVVLNGYLEVVPNTVSKKAWQYKETTTAPVDLPSLTEVRPAMKGWSTNAEEYYTQLQPNGYGVDPGTPTAFEYDVRSFVAPSGASKWGQPPQRYNQTQVSAVTPPQNVNNPAVIQYSYVYPVPDSPVAPPIGTL